MEKQIMFEQTAITCIDSYKIGHESMFPEGTTKVYSNFTPRANTHLNVPLQYKTNKIVWFGLQAFLGELRQVWDDTFFNLSWDIVEKELDIYIPFAGPNGVEKEHFKALHNLQFLPLKIKALPEGMEVPIGVPVLTITNTLPAFYWLPNFLETWMSAGLWQASTSATISRAYRNILQKYVDLTGGSTEFMPWQLHDFSVRGMGGIRAAAMSGAGHLLSSLGTDNIPAVKLINDCYFGEQTFVGGSVPATEHSVMCAGGRESEIETFRRLIKKYPSGVLSIVSDTWDFWNVVTRMAAELKDEIESRVPDQFGLAKVVFRPDSGDPVKIICGYTVIGEYDNEQDYYDAWDNRVFRIGDADAVKIAGKYYRAGEHDVGRASYGPELSEAEVKGAVRCLADTFGTTTNEKGYKTLNQRVGLIYGDSITPERANSILSRLAAMGYAADNIVFGIGSYTFQMVTRDSLGFAMKATYVEIDGVGTPIFKDPKTDSGTKKSAKGLLKVVEENGNIVLKDNVSAEEENEGLLRTVFYNGSFVNVETFEQIRNRLNG